MFHALVVLAADKAEPDKTAFYILGGVWVAWAVVLSAIGIRQPSFAREAGLARGVMAISGVLMVAAMAAAVATS